MRLQLGVLTMLCATILAACAKKQKPVTPTVVVKDTFPTLEERIATEWIQSTQRISAKNVVLYFKGSASGAQNAAGEWNGRVTGDILALILDPSSMVDAIVLPQGTLSVSGRSFSYEGRAKTFYGSAPKWKHLVSN